MTELSGLIPFMGHLYWEMDKPPDPDVLVEMSLNLLDREQTDALLEANISKMTMGSKNSTLAKIAAFDQQLRQDYYLLRRNADEKPRFLSGDFLKENNPLKAEREILKMLWNFLESLKMPVAGVTIDALIIYRLQSQILWRMASFDQEKGQHIFSASTAFDSGLEVA